MIVTKPGNYEALESFKVRTAISIGTVPKGTVFLITQVDHAHHKVYGPVLEDWHYWDLPVRIVP